MKKLAKFLAILSALLISVVLVISLVVDVDKYRPQVVEAANQKINGTLELGKLSLSFWGQFRIDVSSLKLRDGSGREVVSVDHAYFHVPLMSLISGSPMLTLEMNQPTLHVVKNREGQLNLVGLAKTVAPASGSVPLSVPLSVPFAAIAYRAHMGIELNHAFIHYRDELTGLKADVKDLNAGLRMAPKVAGSDGPIHPLVYRGTFTAPSLSVQFPPTGVKVASAGKVGSGAYMDIREIRCGFNYEKLLLDFSDCSAKVFSGTVKGTSQFSFKTKIPQYSFRTEVSGLNMSQAIESKMAMFKNTLTGTAKLTFRGQGASFDFDSAMTALSGSGSLRVEKAVFATIDVMKMVKDGLNESLKKLGEKIPALKGQLITTLPNFVSKYETVSADFTIAEGKFRAPDLIAQAIPNQGIDLKGNTTVGIKDYSLNTSWDLIDTYNLTHLRDISIEEADVQVAHVFAEGNAPVHITVHADCTIMAPCYSYTEIPAYLSKIAITNIGNALAGKSRDVLRKKAESLINKIVPKDLPPGLPPDLKAKLKGLLH